MLGPKRLIVGGGAPVPKKVILNFESDIISPKNGEPFAFAHFLYSSNRVIKLSDLAFCNLDTTILKRRPDK